MLDISKSAMLREARCEANSKEPFKQIGLFFLVFGVGMMIQSVLLVPAVIVWAVREIVLSNGVYNFDASAVMNNLPPWITLLMLFLKGIDIAAVMFYCLKKERRSLRSMGFVREGWLKKYALGYLTGAVMIAAALGISVAFGGTKLSVSAFSTETAVMIALFFAGYIVQGMSEEVMLRSYLLPSFACSLNRKNAAAISLGVSSLIFAALHLGNPGMTPLAFINLLLSGVFFALLVLRTDNIWGAAGAHASWNFFQGHIFGVQVSGIESQTSVLVAKTTEKSLVNGGSFGLEGGLAVTAVLLAATALLLFLPKKANKE